jgi:hypothetical protein
VALAHISFASDIIKKAYRSDALPWIDDCRLVEVVALHQFIENDNDP